MAKRERKRFDYSELAHKWAHGLYNSDGMLMGPTGASMSGGSIDARGRMYAEAYTDSKGQMTGGGMVYSYGRHFPIAERVQVGGHKARRWVYFYNPERRSVTTTRHQWAVESAMRGTSDVYRCPPEFWGDLKARKGGNARKGEGFAGYLQQRIDLAAEDARKPRDRSAHKHAAEVERCLTQWATFRDGLKLTGTGPVPPKDWETIQAKARTDAERAERPRLERTRREEERAGRKAEDYARWATEPHPTDPTRYAVERCDWHNYPPLLRVRPRGGKDERAEVETSLGARVPLGVVRLAYSRICTGQAVPDLGGYGAVRVLRGPENGGALVYVTGVRIGCHTFAWSEVVRFAKACGWCHPDNSGDVIAPEGAELNLSHLPAIHAVPASV